MSDNPEKKEAPAEKSKAIITFDDSIRAMVPRNFEGLWRMATIMASSGMMPKSLESPESVFVAVQMGLEVGLPPMAAVQNIAVINNRPSLWGDAVLGLVRASGLMETFKETFEGQFPDDGFKAVCTAKRKDDPEEIVREFSVDDAKRAGLWQTQAVVTRTSRGGGTYEKDNDSPWWKYPKRMLQMRARSWALRDGFGDVLRGLQVREEAQDYVDLEPSSTGVYSAAENKASDIAARVASRERPTEASDPGPDTSESESEIESETISVGAEDASDGFFISEFINLKSAGFSTYVHKNLDRLKEAPANVIEHAEAKWSKLYPESRWPLDIDPIAEVKGIEPNGYLQDSPEYKALSEAIENLGEDCKKMAMRNAGISEIVTSEDCAKVYREMGIIADYRDAQGA